MGNLKSSRQVGALIKRPTNKLYQLMTNIMKDDGEVSAEVSPECPDEMNIVNIPCPKSCHSWRTCGMNSTGSMRRINYLRFMG